MSCATTFDAHGRASLRITDDLLNRFAAIAAKAQGVDVIADDEAALLIALAEPIARELIRRRSSADLIAQMAADQVEFYPAGSTV